MPNSLLCSPQTDRGCFSTYGRACVATLSLFRLLSSTLSQQRGGRVPITSQRWLASTASRNSTSPSITSQREKVHEPYYLPVLSNLARVKGNKKHHCPSSKGQSRGITGALCSSGSPKSKGSPNDTHRFRTASKQFSHAVLKRHWPRGSLYSWRRYTTVKFLHNVHVRRNFPTSNAYCQK